MMQRIIAFIFFSLLTVEGHAQGFLSSFKGIPEGFSWYLYIILLLFLGACYFGVHYLKKNVTQNTQELGLIGQIRCGQRTHLHLVRYQNQVLLIAEHQQALVIQQLSRSISE